VYRTTKVQKKKASVNLVGDEKHGMTIILLCLLCNVRRLDGFFFNK